MAPIASVEVAEGTFQLGTQWANFHLVTEGTEAILIDAGYPAYWTQVPAVAHELGLSLNGLLAVIVTHHHVDHVGAAKRLQSTTHAVVHVHAADAPMVRGDRRSHVPPGFYRQCWRPSMARYLIHTAAAGGARYRPVPAIHELRDGDVLDLPGSPRVIHTPGHTAGHCSIALDRRGVLLCDDAMVNFDYAAGRHGLGLHRFNDDRAQALVSLSRLEPVPAEIVLFGHGQPWTEGLRRALDAVRSREPLSKRRRGR
jgi:glyoxylase-like metal-dependent hydrolase (beta-lactamase superfamily II)